MSSVVKKRVDLEFINTGLQFEDIAVGDENQTLGEFIESTLLRLEVHYNTKSRNSSIGIISRPYISPKFFCEPQVKGFALGS